MAHYCDRARADRHRDVPLRRALRRGARAAAGRAARALSRAADRRRLVAAVPAAHRRRARRGRRAHQRARAQTSSGWAPASPSRRSGWPRCATAWTRRSSSASAPPSTSMPGSCRRRPSWMQRMGLEWSYRLAREPRRLWRRYASYNPRFIAAFARQYAAHRAGALRRTARRARRTEPAHALSGPLRRHGDLRPRARRRVRARPGAPGRS